MHISIPVANSTEFISMTEISPLISSVQIKVCYVGEQPNRNGTVITRELATEMGRKLPGSPIVGFYNEHTGDFEEHNRNFEMRDGKFRIVDTTKAYGFVPTNAKVWFQKFKDDGVEHLYLCTEGYIWTAAYPESKRILSGNNQSMELNRDSEKGTWANDYNLGRKIFIYNEALIEKLCVLGENFEPCFEGSQIASEFSLQLNQEIEQLRTSMFSLMTEVKNALNKGGTKVFTTYAMEVGDTLWSALYSYLEATYPREGEEAGSKYGICGVYEDGTQKFAVLQDRADNKLYRMNFESADGNFSADSSLAGIEIPSEQLAFSLEDNDNYKKKDEDDEGKKGQEEKDNPQDNPEDNAGKKKEEEDDKKKGKYSLDEIPEYVALQTQYSELEGKYSSLETSYNELKAEIDGLKNFKLETERKDKEAMIESFFMLTDEDKKDCVENIDTYSLDDIEAKLSIICVRNKVNFNAEGQDPQGQAPNLFNLQGIEDQNNDVPAWIQAIRNTAKNN